MFKVLLIKLFIYFQWGLINQERREQKWVDEFTC